MAGRTVSAAATRACSGGRAAEARRAGARRCHLAHGRHRVYVAATRCGRPFVKVGDTVKEGDTLLIVEAMKTMNPIAAPRAGTVSEICIADSQPVEFGQTLLILS